MKQGVLLYALNNEQIDYVEIAYHAAKKAKQHLNLPVAIITDSADWLYEKFPNHREVFDMVIKIVSESDVKVWQSNRHYNVGNLVYHNGTIWRKVKEGNETINVVNKEYRKKLDTESFEPVYIGIEVDKWYPNLPYLAGQHVWYENILYRCHTNYKEKDVFSKDNYEVLIDKVLDYELEPNYIKGDKLLYNRKLWLCNSSRSKRLIIPFDKTKFEPAYLGIEVDKWY
ncbi:hypothetical protein EBU71_14500, partial [bacterium]|nr:hypothetical protein [Candidatus Elulimicrobium humile]